MPQHQQTKIEEASSRMALLEELYKRYHVSSKSFLGHSQQLRYLRKKYGWLLVVGGANFTKRLFDIFVAATGLIALAPLFGIVAAIIKITDNGPVFFCQNRVGQWGREFVFPKFRSMRVDADRIKEQLKDENDHSDSITFKMKNDPRITLIGRIIRKLSIDELPQLWCVLKGDMTLVGPRPAVPEEVAEYTLKDRRRLDVKPGLTCIWQVSGRGDIPFDEQVELDVKYIESQSLWLDFKLLAKTVPAVLLGRGAY